MKTIAFILCFVSLTVLAQAPDTTTNDAVKEEYLRRALRAALGGNTNVPPPPAIAADTAASNNIPSAPATPPPAAPAIGTAIAPAATTNATPFVPKRPRGAINPAAFGTNNPALTNRTLVGPLGTPVPPNGTPTPVPPAGLAFPPNGPGAVPGGIPGQIPGAVPGALPGATTAGQPPEEMMPAGTINFPAVSLENVLPVYAELVGKTILHAQLPAVTISLKTQTALTRSEAIQALDSVLAMNGITMVPFGDKFIKAVAAPFPTAAPFTSRDVSELPETDTYITQITQLKYAKPSELVQALTPFSAIQGGILPIDSSGILVIRDYSANVKRMLELINKIDVTVPLDYDSEVIPIKYAQAADIASALSSLGGGGGTTIGHSATTGGGTGGSRLGGLGGGMGTGTGTYGGGLNQNGITNPTQPNSPFGNNPAAGRTSSFTDRLNSIVKRAASQGDFQVLGQTKIIADQRTNSLLVFAGKQDMEMIKKIVAELDIVLAQVLIEAIIMEVSLDNSRNVGVSYLQNSPVSAGHGYFNGIGGLNNGTFLNPGSFANVGTNVAAAIPSGFSYFANFGNDFQATATAIAADSRITVLSRPRIQTSHGVAASLQVGDTVPEISGTYFNGIGGAGSSSQYQQVFVGIQLQVTPLINPDGLVVMDIMQDVEQLGTPTTIDGNPVPTTSKRTAQATVSVRDRDTIILGGMISTTKSTSHSGLPFLKDIPGVGYLFRSSNDDMQRKELIVLIRPTVLPTPEAAAMVATHERAKLPAVKAAERDIQLDENKRMQEADKIKVPPARD